jgi:HEPN domain-containing protein
MNEAERLALVQRWLRYAREDLLAAEAMLGQQNMWPRHACWLAQQSAEKALKAILVFLQIDFPRRHDLDEQRNLVPEGWRVKTDHPDLAALTEWAVESRYPGEWSDATEDEARVAVQQARSVWNSVSADFAQRGIDAEHAA